MKHTQGPWKYHEDVSPIGQYYVRGANGEMIVSGPSLKNEADAKLIAEAGTVAHETGLTPRQLKDQRDELLEAFDSLLGWAIFRSDWFINGVDEPADHPISKAKAAISKAKGVSHD